MPDVQAFETRMTDVDLLREYTEEIENDADIKRIIANRKLLGMGSQDHHRDTSGLLRAEILRRMGGINRG